MGNRLSGLGSALYDSKRKEFLGRDGARWGKLGVFYFFFYLGLAGFFCAMLAVFMAFTPRDHPYYTEHDSRMETRSNPLSPGLGFRPQPDVDKNLISAERHLSAVGRNALQNDTIRYIKSLDQYLKVYYWGNAVGQGASPQFSIGNPGGCRTEENYGYSSGRPCVLVKMNKIVNFVPEPFDANENIPDFPNECRRSGDSVPIACQGEFQADADNIGSILYYSERGSNPYCGSLSNNKFPFMGKQDRQDVYQAPYIWAQFQNPTPNVLINVICRVYAKNIDIDKKTGRGLTRFQIFVADSNNLNRSPRSVEEI